MTGRSTSSQFETTHELARSGSWPRWVVYWGLICTFAILPFELISGLVFPGLTLTNVELVSSFTLLGWVWLLVAERRRPQVSSWLLGSAGLAVTVLLLSAVLAEQERAGAIKFALRQAQGALIACCLAERLRHEGSPFAYKVGMALLLGSGVSAILGLLELTEWPPLLTFLELFKEQRALVGGFLRLGGTFSYANTAAMYFEAVLGLALLYAAGGVFAPLTGRGQEGRFARWKGAGRLLLFFLPILLLLAIIFTYSRAALVVSGLVLVCTPLVAWRAGGWQQGRRVGFFASGLLLLSVALVLGMPALQLRLSEPDIGRWYRARYEAQPLTTMAPGEVRQVPVTLVNEGLSIWTVGGARPFRLSYHWLRPNGQVVRFEGLRSELPYAVAPGEAVTIQARVQAPEKVGEYLLAWDMVRENMGGGWFSQLGTPPVQIAVTVAGEVVPTAPAQSVEPGTTPRKIESIPQPPARGPLWATAITLWREQPLLGIGPDVFRHVYGPRMGLSRFDDRVHTNNLYLELLTGAGIVGLLSFCVLIGQALWRGWRALWRGADKLLLGGAFIGLLAFLAHGLLDVFLAFTPTYMLLWGFLGMLDEG
jgi:hypothetical protein